MILSWPNRPLTFEEWEAFPEDSAIALELAEGMLVMCPRPPARHQKARTRVGTVLDAQLCLGSSPQCPTSNRIDRVLKFSEYAEAGIRQYWIVDLDEPTSLLAYLLVDGNYELSGEHTGKAALDVAGHPIEIDLPALTRR